MFFEDAQEAAHALAAFLEGKRTIVVSGAGTSTDAGLPDYRGTGTTQEPSIDFNMFVTDPVWRAWVWQRNHETWRQMLRMQPTPAHHAIAALERAGLVSGNATQNVDGLDRASGQDNVWELHGSFATVDCIDCSTRFPREEYGELLSALNPGWPETDELPVILAPARRADAERSTFRVAPCPRCGGIVKPSVVFFGEGLPSEAMDGAMSAATAADAVLVVGTSLQVSTGMWVMRQAWAQGGPVAIVNRGATAGDRFADLRVDAGASEVLERTVELLGA
ncbi:NAD-dependent SIR2 family protein deacetylase [Arcanobacterium wilhelmae]|uniref:protein acetyllysine N-acetyltransferase n=1 Tax=Arcanobacterium wilhelmae TaxID=1803177 RepID=A0ABT9NAD2_9ACTO|nr:Sir2 family NAD-dependent protein deacetylase [Arcanobacterium wilhelmae]MDP9800678.1 NAD-dependent SIR2 family protein deacetylase [Arcanobacterium wilhelmae]WFN90078.1 Sir2 family NAD-dependent protein deacetylase [Arcanobacterium wilhelmae]